MRALLDLYREGNLDPSSDEITARAGISQRSLFRYFDDLDDLARTAIDRARQDVLHLVEIDVDTSATLRDRVTTLTRARAELWEDAEYIAQVTRLRAPFQPVVAEQLAATREYLRDQVRSFFAPEFDAMEPGGAQRALAMADVVTSFESWRLLRDDQGLDREETTRSVADALITILQTGARP